MCTVGCGACDCVLKVLDWGVPVTIFGILAHAFTVAKQASVRGSYRLRVCARSSGARLSLSTRYSYAGVPRMQAVIIGAALSATASFGARAAQAPTL